MISLPNTVQLPVDHYSRGMSYWFRRSKYNSLGYRPRRLLFSHLRIRSAGSGDDTPDEISVFPIHVLYCFSIWSDVGSRCRHVEHHRSDNSPNPSADTFGGFSPAGLNWVFLSCSKWAQSIWVCTTGALSNVLEVTGAWTPGTEVGPRSRSCSSFSSFRMSSRRLFGR